MKAFIFSTAVFIAASSLCLGSSLTTWTEGEYGQGDAGGVPGSANVTIGGGTLTDIIGALSDETAGADMYEIYIPNLQDFTATSTGTGDDPIVNPALYLFNASGDGLYGDDNTGAGSQASISGASAASASPGLYYILIVPSGHLPENGSTLLFGDLTNTIGQANALSSLVIKKYATSGTTPSPADSGKDYDIVLTGADFAEAPEPGTVALMGLGMAALAWRSRRVRR